MTEEKKKKEKKNRFIVTGYVCANCDTDFGINEFGCNVREGIQTARCPVCGCPILHVYYWVEWSDKQFPSPTMNKEILDLINKQKDHTLFEHVVPPDGGHGVDASMLDDDDDCNDEDEPDQCGCGCHDNGEDVSEIDAKNRSCSCRSHQLLEE